LFKSTNFRRSQTELVIIVTPYLVRPVSGQLAAPTDGYRAPNDASQVFGGQLYNGVNGSRAIARTAPAPGMSVPLGAGSSAAIAAPAPAAANPGFKL
jgi:pilus assembly protein CpaC